MTTNEKLCIGIDLGTTNSCLAYLNPDTDSVEIISNSIGERITPSIVRILENDILIGNLATEDIQDEDEERLEKYPVISHVKRFIGQKYGDSRETIEMLEYEIEADHNDYPMIPIGDRKMKPEEISAQVLRYLKESAEEYLGQEVTEAVVTVPAYFNEAQRRATKDACTLAGLNCLRLVAEPTAACLCYGLHKSQEECVLVFDLGGGTLDCSILNLFGGIFEVVATSGNTQLGGADIDHLIVEFLQEEYERQTGKGYEIGLSLAEDIKKKLSNLKQTVVRLPNFKYVFTRNKFEELISDFVEACMEPVDQVLSDAGLASDQISQVVLVGGSTRVPVIQRTLCQMFDGRPLNKSINPDEAVAYGAAVQASVLQKVGSKAKDLVLLDVNPLSLGIETTGSIMNILIKRNSTLPCEAKKVFSTVDDNQEAVEIKVYQGERQFTYDNIKLGNFMLEGLPRAPRGIPKIVVTFKLNCDGLLEVSAVDKNTGLANDITLSSESNLSDNEIHKLLKDAELYRTRDYNKKQAIDELNKFEKYIFEMQRQANLDEMQEVLDENLSPLNQYLINTMDWIVTNRDEADLETIRGCRETVEFNLKPYLDIMYSHREQLEKSGVRVDSEKQPDVGHINQLIEDMCQDLK